MTVPDIATLIAQPHADTPVPTGSMELDRVMGGGSRPGELIVASGYPGMGASMFALGFARAAAIRNGLGTYLASLESTSAQVARRVLAAEARVGLHHLNAGNLVDDEPQRIAGRRHAIEAAPLHVSDRDRDMAAIRRTTEGLATGAGLGLLVVDGAHLLTPAHDYGGRAQFADDFARDLKELAVEFQTPVVVTLPLEYPFGTRTDQLPLLRDFGKRQSFVAAADVVVLIHRPDYYDRESPRAGEADLIVAKNRNGLTDTILAAFQGHYSKFVDMAQG